MIKKILNYIFIFICAFIILTYDVKADENLDMSNWVTASGRYWSISGLEYSTNKTFNNEVLLNNYNVVGGRYFPPTDYDYVEWSYFERSGSPYNPCGQSSFSIDMWFLFTNGSFVENVKSVRWGDNMCSITDKNSTTGRVYATCIVPHTTSSYNDIFIDYYNFTTNAGVSSDLYISRYNKVSCSLDTQSIITNNNINTDKIIESNEKTQEKLDDLNDSINDSDTSGATGEASDFFSGFETNTFGLTSIITAPLDLIGSITSSSCSPLGLQVPFVENTTLNLPCMSTIYQKHFGSFLSIYQTVTFGIIAYWVCVRIFALVKDFKNPDHDEIEVLDL